VPETSQARSAGRGIHYVGPQLFYASDEPLRPVPLRRPGEEGAAAFR
jgi:hypothetical protein